MGGHSCVVGGSLGPDWRPGETLSATEGTAFPRAAEGKQGWGRQAGRARYRGLALERRTPVSRGRQEPPGFDAHQWGSRRAPPLLLARADSVQPRRLGLGGPVQSWPDTARPDLLAGKVRTLV